MLDEEGAALVAEEAFFEADLAFFDFGEDLLELAESFLEVFGRGLVLLAHGSIINVMRLMGAINALSPASLLFGGFLLAIICLLPIWVRRNLRRGPVVLGVISLILAYESLDYQPVFYEFTNRIILEKEIAFATFIVSLAGILLEGRGGVGVAWGGTAGGGAWGARG